MGTYVTYIIRPLTQYIFTNMKGCDALSIHEGNKDIGQDG